jgi:hypothetical protein
MYIRYIAYSVEGPHVMLSQMEGSTGGHGTGPDSKQFATLPKFCISNQHFIHNSHLDAMEE